MPKFQFPPSGKAVLAIGAAMLLLGGCQTRGERMMAEAKRRDTCGAKRMQQFVGRKADLPTREAIEPGGHSGRRVRWIAPGDEIIADLQAGRLNVALDASGTIQSIDCW